MDTLVGKDEGNIHVNICTTLCEADHSPRSGSCFFHKPRQWPSSYSCVVNLHKGGARPKVPVVIAPVFGPIRHSCVVQGTKAA